MGEAAERTSARWSLREGALDIADEMNRLTLEIAGRTLFGQDISADSDAIGGALYTVLKHFDYLVGAALPWPERWPTRANREFWRAIDTMNEVVDKIIADRAEAEPQPDLLGMFMASIDEEDGTGMSHQQLKDEIFTMLLAGHETTANALSFTLMQLARHPEVARRVREEIATVLQGEAPTAMSVRNLQYTTQVIKESMRLYPPVWMVGRKAENADEIGGYHVPKNTFVYMSPWVVHRHPALWTDPDTFDPDRWHPDRIAARKATGQPRFAYFPFSGGRRQCIGDQFALMEAAIVIATLLPKHKLTLLPGHQLKLAPHVTLRPSGGLPMHRTPPRPPPPQKKNSNMTSSSIEHDVKFN